LWFSLSFCGRPRPSQVFPAAFFSPPKNGQVLGSSCPGSKLPAFEVPSFVLLVCFSWFLVEEGLCHHFPLKARPKPSLPCAALPFLPPVRLAAPFEPFPPRDHSDPSPLLPCSFDGLSKVFLFPPSSYPFVPFFAPQFAKATSPSPSRVRLVFHYSQWKLTSDLIRAVTFFDIDCASRAFLP